MGTPPVPHADPGTPTPPATGRSAPLLVLRYRSVRPDPDGAVRGSPVALGGDVSVSRLDAQLSWLRGRGLRGVPVGELLRAHAAGESAGLVGLTFDSGHAGFLADAVPVLRRHGCAATVFVVPGLLGGVSSWEPPLRVAPLLTADGIRAVAEAGMEVGSLGLYHLTLRGASEALLREEVEKSRERLAEITGCPPEGFSYPYGQVDARSAAVVRGSGYGYACALDPGALTGQYALPRMPVAERDTPWLLAVKRRLHPVLRRPVPTAGGGAGAAGEEERAGARLPLPTPVAPPSAAVAAGARAATAVSGPPAPTTLSGPPSAEGRGRPGASAGSRGGGGS